MKIFIFCTLTIYSIATYANTADLGAQTYNIACKKCHASSVSAAIKAPTAFDVKAWNKRFKNAKQEANKDPQRFPTAIDYLLYRASIGKGLMPHGGLCKEANVANKNCSDAALKAAILYMSQRK